jgi:UDP-N-acetylmuramoyl-tripeptide--D-alanyl-D-alanine ligase
MPWPRTARRLRQALAWRARATASAARPAWVRTKHELARVYRPALRRVCFVGVTGSCGKTTTTALIGAVLASRSRGLTSNQLYNGPEHVALSIFRVRPWHRFCAHELGGSRPGILARTVEIFQPHVGVVTHVGNDHHTSFRTLAATATEKATLVQALPADGTAVLNADDPRVLAMRERTRARVITYGLSPVAAVRGAEVSSAWPERLSLTVTHADDRVHVRTRLLGEHWAPCILAAMATGVAMGVPLPEAARAIETVEPVEGRMSPYTTADGVTFIDDGWKAPLWTISADLRFLQTARTRRRKLVIVGTISDYSGSSSRTYAHVAGKAMAVADRVLFVGPLAHCALKARSHARDDCLLAFDTLYELDRFLRDDLAAGDLLLLKGSRHTDHLERLILARTNDIACWRLRCGRGPHCAHCELHTHLFLPAPGSS